MVINLYNFIRVYFCQTVPINWPSVLKGYIAGVPLLSEQLAHVGTLRTVTYTEAGHGTQRFHALTSAYARPFYYLTYKIYQL